MQNITIEYAKNKALEQLRAFEPLTVEETAVDTLRKFPWGELLRGSYDQNKLVRLNLDLDPHGCLGRAALCCAIVEQYFRPHMSRALEYAEICDDWFHYQLMKQWKSVYKSGKVTPPETWLDELLMYEEPHGIILIHGEQIEPLASLFPDQDVQHFGFYRFPAWEAVTSAMVVSQALSVSDPTQRLDLLSKAELLCPETFLVAQARVQPLVELDRMDEALKTLHRLTKMRSTARVFFVLEEVFSEKHPMSMPKYGPDLWGLLKQRLEREIKQ